MAVAGQYAGAGLCGRRDVLGRIQYIEAVADDTHDAVTEFQHICVCRFELERDQPPFDRAAFDLTNKFCARPARCTAMRMHNHVQQLSGALPVFVQLDTAL